MSTESEGPVADADAENVAAFRPRDERTAGGVRVPASVPPLRNVGT